MTLLSKAEAVSVALRALHSTLMHLSRADFERERGAISGPGHLLQLLSHDQFFAWLRPLSALITDIDELTLKTKGELTPQTASSIRTEAEAILGGALGENYVHHLQDVDVVVAHGAVKRAFALLPTALPSNPGDDLHAAHQWNEIRDHRRASKD